MPSTATAEQIFRRCLEKLGFDLISNSKAQLKLLEKSETLLDDTEIDSMDRIEIAIEIESETGAEVPDDDAEEWKTVGDILKSIEKARASAAS